MRSFTCPPETWSQRCASSFRISCQVEPWGASVPSLMVTPCASAHGANAASAAARASFFTAISFVSEEQVVRVREERLRAPLGEDVGEPQVGIRARVGAEDLLEDARELRPVLALHEHALREGDERTELLVHRERED